MSLEDPILTELILRITLKPQLLASQALAELFLPQVNLPSVPLGSSQQVLLVQSPSHLKGERLVNQEKSTQEPNASGVKGIVTLPASARVKLKFSL